MKPVAIDLFCGGGGASLGYLDAGFEIVGAFDNWKHGVDAYNSNVHKGSSKIAKLLDLSDPLESIGPIRKHTGHVNIDVVFASPPCTDFSLAGNRKEGKAARLSESCATIISWLSPRYFVIENVPAFAKTDTYVRTLDTLENAGYSVIVFTMNASEAGTPQSRNRMFVIGILKPSDGELDELLEDLISSLSDKPMVVRDAFSPEELDFQYYYICPRSKFKRGIFSVDFPCPTLRTNCMNRLNRETYEIRPADAGTVDKCKQLERKHMLVLQGFPDNYSVDYLSAKSFGRILGNSVPPPMASYVGSKLIRHFRKSAKNQNRVLTDRINPSTRSSSRNDKHLAKTPSNMEGCREDRRSHRKRRILEFLELEPESTDADIQSKAEDMGVTLSRKSGSLRSSYVSGASSTIDKQMNKISGFLVPEGWNFQVRERLNKGNRIDDVYWIPAGHKRIRSKKQAKIFIESECKHKNNNVC